jgi:hypothetical protein
MKRETRHWALGSRQQGVLMWTSTLFFGIAWLAGCSGFAVRSGRDAEPIPGPETPGPMRGTIGDNGEVTTSAGASRQVVCRGTPYPRGWVSVDYVQGGNNCGGSASEGTYSAVVLQRLAPLPAGTLLIVCSGQSIPRNWRRTFGEVSSSGQCPRNAGDKDTGPTVMQIERVS